VGRQNLGKDWQSRVLGGDLIPTNSAARQPFGTATAAPAATTLTDTGRTLVTDEFLGHIIVSGQVYGVILTNSATVITVDKWYAPNNPGGAAGTTPLTNDKYTITPGGMQAQWMGITETAGVNVADTALAGELSGSGWTRALCTWAHTTNVASYTETNTFTSADASARTLQVMGLFNASRLGILVFETAIPSPPTLVSGDQCTVTETVTI
jgi:hypothetical protein